MSLSDLIRYGPRPERATAIAATSAIPPREEGAAVAGIATVAVAKRDASVTGYSVSPPAHESALRWQIIWPTGKTIEVVQVPPATRAEMEAAYPGTQVRVVILRTDTEQPLTDAEQVLLHRWLAHIGETDPVMIDNVLQGCERQQATRAYYLNRAREVMS